MIFMRYACVNMTLLLFLLLMRYLHYLFVLTTPAPTTAPLSTGVAVAISVVITFIVTLVIGLFIGLLVMHFCSRKKAVYSPTAEGQANVGPTVPAGPVYEEVSLKEEIELNTNEAYGPINL